MIFSTDSVVIARLVSSVAGIVFGFYPGIEDRAPRPGECTR